MARLLYKYLHSVCHTLLYVESAEQRYVIRKGRCILIACSYNYRSFSLTLHGGSFPFEKDFICVCVCVVYGYIVWEETSVGVRRRLWIFKSWNYRWLWTAWLEGWRLNLGPSKDLQVFFTAKPALSPNSAGFLKVSDGESEAINCSSSGTAYRNPLIYSVFE